MFNFVGVHPSWNEFFDSPDVDNELRSISDAVLHDCYYPHEDDVLKVFAIDRNKIQCIIVAQDSYPRPDGTGLCVATGRSIEPAREIYGLDGWQSTRIPSSAKGMLKAIYVNQRKCAGASVSIKDVRKAIVTGAFDIAQPDALWDSLERQGVMMLNMALTVKCKAPGSHLDLWQAFISMLVNYLFQTRPNAEWLLFGKGASERFKKLPDLNGSGVSRAASIPCPQIHSFTHPSRPGFVRENPFTHAPMIDWTGLRAI